MSDYWTVDGMRNGGDEKGSDRADYAKSKKKKKKEKKETKAKKKALYGTEYTYSDLCKQAPDGVYLVKNELQGKKHEIYVVKKAGQYPTTICGRMNYKEVVEDLHYKDTERVDNQTTNKVMYAAKAVEIVLPKELVRDIIDIVYPKRKNPKN